MATPPLTPVPLRDEIVSESLPLTECTSTPLTPQVPHSPHRRVLREIHLPPKWVTFLLWNFNPPLSCAPLLTTLRSEVPLGYCRGIRATGLECRLGGVPCRLAKLREVGRGGWPPRGRFHVPCIEGQRGTVAPLLAVRERHGGSRRVRSNADRGSIRHPDVNPFRKRSTLVDVRFRFRWLSGDCSSRTNEWVRRARLTSNRALDIVPATPVDRVRRARGSHWSAATSSAPVLDSARHPRGVGPGPRPSGWAPRRDVISAGLILHRAQAASDDGLLGRGGACGLGVAPARFTQAGSPARAQQGLPLRCCRLLSTPPGQAKGKGSRRRACAAK